MPSFRIPCWPSKDPSHFDEPEVELVPANEPVNPAKEQGVLAKPSPAEYTSEGAKEFLVALEAVAGLIPLPGIVAAVKIARNIIQACDDTHATLERADELKSRIKTLVAILVDELKEKKEGEEIQAELREDIQSLSKVLEYIQGKLNDIASQNAMLLIFFRNLNDKKVKECVDCLNNSLGNFSLVRQINEAKFFDKLEKRIIDFHTSHQKSLDDLTQKVDLLHLDMDDIKAILEARNPSTASSSAQPRSRAAIPPNASIFHGRDSDVAKLVGILTLNLDGQKRAHVCLLGPGGMGKTSTALAVMADPEMRKHFPEKNQIWVPCVKATTYLLFLETLYSSFAISQKSGDALSDIIFEIKSSPMEPLVILLDNFETLWNVAESQSDTEQALNKLDQIAHVTIIMTMRSSHIPFNGKQWQSFPINAVDEKAAHQIYRAICPADDRNDSELSALLEALGYMPLAITLMANMAKSIGLGADELMEDYKHKGTAAVGKGVDAQHSLDICISLSVDSPPMKKHPDAYKLLVSLAMLPVGTTYVALGKWWARDSPDLMGALQVLTDTALIQRRGTHYFVLPVIRSYILDSSDPSRFRSDVHDAMITSACNFLKQHNSSPGDPSFKEHAVALSAEEGNLQAILLNVTNPEPGLIETFLVLAEHQFSTRPRLQVIEHVLQLATSLKESDPKLVGDVQTCYGKILHMLDRYDDAVKQHTLARETFLSIPNEQLAARSLLYIVDVYAAMPGDTFQKQLDLVKQAKSVFEKRDDGPLDVARSVYYLGTVRAQHGYRTEGIDLLNRALDMFQGRVDVLYQAKCLYYLELVYYWERRYDDALKAGEAAVQRYEALGQYSGDAIGLLGTILFMKGDYPNALETSVRALEICKSYGGPVGIAQTLEMIGRIWAKMDQQESALGAYEEAMRYYGTILHVGTRERGMTRSQFLIRQAEDPSLVPTPEERDILRALYNDFLLPEDES